MSDMHRGRTDNTHLIHSKLLRKVSEEDFDVIVLAGDNASTKQPEIESLFKAIRAAIPLKPVYAVRGNHDCLDEETECLTNNGWKHFSQINKEDQVLGLDSNKTAKWQLIENIIIKEKNGKMCSIDTETLNLMCTDNHRILSEKRKSKKWCSADYTYAKDFKGRHRILVSGNTTESNCSLSDAEIYLSGLIITDCHINKTNNTVQGFTLYQRESKSHIFRKAIESVGLSYKERTRDRDIKEICGKKLKKKPEPGIEFVIDPKEARAFLKKVSIESRDVPKWAYEMSDKQFDVFLDAVIEGDGTRYRDTAYALYKHKAFLDDFQAICAMHGYHTHIYQYGDNFRLNIAKRTSVQIEVISTGLNAVDYNGKVWCLTVPYGNFFIRRRGKVQFTGNCWDMDCKTPLGMKIANWNDVCAKYNIISLDGQMVEVGGIKIYGWHNWYGSPRHVRGTNDEYRLEIEEDLRLYKDDMDSFWRYIDAGIRADVLINHMPIVPNAQYKLWNGIEHQWEALKEYNMQPRVYLHGHTHQERDTVIDGVRVVMCGSDYDRPAYKIVEV